MVDEDYSIPKWYLLKPETARFLLEQGEKNLMEQIAAADALTKRAEFLMNGSIVLLTALVTYVVYIIDTQVCLSFLFWTAVYGAILATIILWQSTDIYWVYKIRPLGQEPKKMITDAKLKSRYQELAFIVTRIRSIQQNIEHNKTQHAIRIDKFARLRFTVKVAITIAFAIGVGYLTLI